MPRPAPTTLEPLPIEFATNISEPVRRREEGVLVADLAQLRSTIASLNAQLAEKQATKDRLTTTIAAREKLIELAKERVAMRQKLDTMGSGSRAQTIESLEQLATQITTDTGDRGQLIETDAAMRSLDRKSQEAVAQFVADQSQKLAAVEQKRDHLEQELIKAQSKANRTELKAPIAGTVQQLAVSSLGQVVASGQSLLTIVPLGGSIEVQAMIANQDIGFVEVGQPAVDQGRRLSRSPDTAPSTASSRKSPATRSISAMRPFSAMPPMPPRRSHPRRAHRRRRKIWSSRRRSK